jgi:formyltetrahydrofolate-dependent phosphoribosylglycinamide formyltransferase
MNIAIFASGAGSNAEVILQKLPILLQGYNVKISLILTNNIDAGVLNVARQFGITAEVILLKNVPANVVEANYLRLLEQYDIDFIVLAGYLKKIPAAVTAAYPQKIINIHPALLPAYGGAGMYGRHVHEAVLAAGEKKSGITVHYVDEVYDHGQIIFQATCPIDQTDTAATLAQQILGLEHQHYSEVIAQVILSQFPVK